MRNFPDWLSAFVKYASVTEAPKRMHFWSGVSAIAGALRRKVWIDMRRFTWYPSFYIVFVAPPGIVSKSTTADIAMNLLLEVPGINFGPDVVTWQSLVTSFAKSCEQFEYRGEYWPMSAMTLVASEFGNLVNPQDRDMVNLYITLWDGRKKLEKQTKMSGNDLVEAPFINMIGCTTPHWIADNMPVATVGGGFTSRCVFIYADTKEKYTAYVDEEIPDGDDDYRIKLIQDLEHIAMQLVGPYTITPGAREWGKAWYESFWKDAVTRMDNTMLEGYAARKQTHMHKLAMVLSAATGDSMEITADQLQLANVMLTELEADMPKVFSRIGRSEESIQAERFIDFINRHGNGGVDYAEAYKMIHAHFPDAHDFEGIMQGAINSGQIKLIPLMGGGFKFVGTSQAANRVADSLP